MALPRERITLMVEARKNACIIFFLVYLLSLQLTYARHSFLQHTHKTGTFLPRNIKEVALLNLKEPSHDSPE
jgi:hypothetical protein